MVNKVSDGIVCPRCGAKFLHRDKAIIHLVKIHANFITLRTFDEFVEFLVLECRVPREEATRRAKALPYSSFLPKTRLKAWKRRGLA